MQGQQERKRIGVRAATNMQTLCIVLGLIEMCAFESHKIGGKNRASQKRQPHAKQTCLEFQIATTVIH